jgi:hypothetical protein
MAADYAIRVAGNQRQRLVGNLMGFAERELYPDLTPTQQRAFRDKVLQAVGQYHDAVLDLLKASVEDGSAVNEHAIRLIEDIHRCMVDG